MRGGGKKNQGSSKLFFCLTRWHVPQARLAGEVGIRIKIFLVGDAEGRGHEERPLKSTPLRIPARSEKGKKGAGCTTGGNARDYLNLSEIKKHRDLPTWGGDGGGRATVIDKEGLPQHQSLEKKIR